jgi:hypothetical protein
MRGPVVHGRRSPRRSLDLALRQVKLSVGRTLTCQTRDGSRPRDA